MWTEKELDENTKELYKLLKSCKYTQQSHKSAVSIDNETSYQVANNIQSDWVCEDTCSCQDSDLNVGGIILNVEEFLKDNKQFEGEKHIHNTLYNPTACYFSFVLNPLSPKGSPFDE